MDVNAIESNFSPANGKMMQQLAKKMGSCVIREFNGVQSSRVNSVTSHQEDSVFSSTNQ